MDDSYLEQLIQALPEAERPTARAAFKAISETGDEGPLGRLLVVLRANNAYAATIPKELAAVAEKLLRELDARVAQQAKQQTESEAQREKRLGEIIAKQVPLLGKALALDRVAAGVEAQAAELGRVGRTLSRLRHLRVGGLLLLMGLAGCLGAGAVVGLYWRPYHDAQRAVNFLTCFHAAGVYLSNKDLENGGVHVTVEGEPVLRGTDWRTNTNKYTVGADFYFPAGGGQ